ncbi:MAG: PAS domain S-box protein, partial [Desulfonatronovibrio sp.]
MPPHSFPQTPVLQTGKGGFQNCEDFLINAPVGIFTSSPDGRFLSVNQAMTKQLGYSSPDELTDSDLPLAAQAYAIPAVKQELLDLLSQDDQVLNYDCKLLRRDMKLLWVNLTIRVMRDQNGNVTHYQGFSTDISHQKRAEGAFRNELEEHDKSRAALSKMTRQFCVLFKKSRDGIVMINHEHQVVDANPAFARMLGYPLEKVREMNIWDWEADKTREQIEARLAGDPPKINDLFETRFQRQDGSVINVEVCVTGERLKDRDVYIGICRDITERKRMEEDLLESKEKFKTLAEKSPVSIMLFDQNGFVIFLNEWHQKVFSLDKLDNEFFMGRHIHELPGLVNAGIDHEVARIFKGESVEIKEV